MGEKICGKCQKSKPLTLFPKNRFKRDGYSYVCRICTNLNTRMRYARRALERVEDDAGEKVCTGCLQTKPLPSFPKHPLSKDGRNARCKACIKERMDLYWPEYQKNNREKYRASQKKWYAKHRERLNEECRRERQQSPEVRKKEAIYKRRWLVKHRAEFNSNRRHLLKCRPKWANRFFLSEIYHLAALRTKVTGIEWHVDHIVPLRSPVVCGLHVENNLQVIPAVANRKKNNKFDATIASEGARG